MLGLLMKVSDTVDFTDSMELLYWKQSETSKSSMVTMSWIVCRVASIVFFTCPARRRELKTSRLDVVSKQQRQGSALEHSANKQILLVSHPGAVINSGSLAAQSWQHPQPAQDSLPGSQL